MKAVARIVAELAGGRTALRVLKGEAPLLPRRTGPEEVHLVGGAAGPLGGDDLSLEIEVGPGARLWLRTVAASIALPGRDGAESRLAVHATVGEGGFLAFLPEPIVAAARCRHHNASVVEVAAGARLLWREEAVFGRHGEPPATCGCRRRFAETPGLGTAVTSPSAPRTPTARRSCTARACWQRWSQQRT
ncbi:urease accessory protein UreD [Dactylosporangium darangshiense]|uniref:urease accessory protein UreD n=1 Tax=Dactylosporangium darangshiense TaxID=579108 RepID=UPI0036426D63